MKKYYTLSLDSASHKITTHFNLAFKKIRNYIDIDIPNMFYFLQYLNEHRVLVYSNEPNMLVLSPVFFTNLTFETHDT
jgi:hypothetical protein